MNTTRRIRVGRMVYSMTNPNIHGKLVRYEDDKTVAVVQTDRGEVRLPETDIDADGGGGAIWE
jgi:hypothetical protein